MNIAKKNSLYIDMYIQAHFVVRVLRFNQVRAQFHLKVSNSYVHRFQSPAKGT